MVCGDASALRQFFLRLKTRHFTNFAARRDWRLHRDEACYCPVSGMPSGWGDGESVGHLCRCFSGRGGFATPMKGFLQASKNLKFRRLVWKNFIYFFLD